MTSEQRKALEAEVEELLKRLNSLYEDNRMYGNGLSQQYYDLAKKHTELREQLKRKTSQSSSEEPENDYGWA